MKAHLAKLTPRVRMLLAIPALLMAYPIVTIALPAALRAAMPDAVRVVLSFI
jgi:hypothetical protein